MVMVLVLLLVLGSFWTRVVLWMAASVLCNCLCSLIEFKCVSQYAILQNALHTWILYMYTNTHTHTHISKVHSTLSLDLTACRRSFRHFSQNVDNQTMPTVGSRCERGMMCRTWLTLLHN